MYPTRQKIMTYNNNTMHNPSLYLFKIWGLCMVLLLYAIIFRLAALVSLVFDTAIPESFSILIFLHFNVYRSTSCGGCVLKPMNNTVHISRMTAHTQKYSVYIWHYLQNNIQYFHIVVCSLLLAQLRFKMLPYTVLPRTEYIVEFKNHKTRVGD